MSSTIHIPDNPLRARCCLCACLAIAAILIVEARGVEPVAFLQAIEEESASGPIDVSEEASEPEEASDDESPPVSSPPGSAVERVAFESRLMRFPDEGESTDVVNTVDGDDAETVLVEPLSLPEPESDLGTEIAVADYGRNAVFETIDVLPEESMLMDESGLEEMPVQASSGKWFSSGFWYASAESLWYERSRNKRVTVGIDTLDPRIQFTTLAQPFDTAPGVRATFGRSLGRDYLDRDRFLEFTYYGGLQWQGIDGWNSLTSAPTLISPLGINVPGFNLANVYRTSLDSNFNSIELNFKLRRRLGRDQMVMSPNGGWSRHAERGFLPGLILGTRLARVDEDFWFRSSRNGVSLDNFRGDYDITTQNWLLGMNIGGELVSQNEFYYWGLRGRVAPALTFAAAQQTVIGINNTNLPQDPIVPSPVFREDRNTQTSPGFIGDLTLFAGWNITPNFSLKAGYDFLWVAGIATATRQFNLDNIRENPMDAGGQIFYNGVSFGLEGSW